MRSLLEHSLNYLQRVTSEDFGDGREMRSPPIRVVGFVVVQHEGLVEIRSRVVNMGEPSTYYVRIHIENLGDDGGDKTLSSVNNGLISFSEDELEERDVKVSCNCKDFYWRFAYWNAENDTLLGPRPRPYTKLTNRPPVNPTKTPGICKHIIAVKNHLERLI